CALSRNSIAAHFTRRNRMRLIRWMMMGVLTSSAPATKVHGLRNAESIGASLGVGGRDVGVSRALGRGQRTEARGQKAAPAFCLLCSLDSVFLPAGRVGPRTHPLEQELREHRVHVVAGA